MKNSRLSNFTPEQKKGFYLKNSLDSVKLHLMMMQPEPWEAQAIREHYQQMMDVLLKSLASKHVTE